MKKELKKLEELYEEYNKLYDFLRNEPNKKSWTGEEELVLEKMDALRNEVDKNEELFFGKYFISPDGGEHALENIKECSEEEWTRIINVFKHAVLKVEEITNHRGVYFTFLQAVLSKACTELWEE